MCIENDENMHISIVMCGKGPKHDKSALQNC